MRTLRRFVRIPLLFVHVVVGVVVILAATGWDRLRRRSLHQGLARRMQVFWCWSICRLLGVRIHVHGVPAVDPPALFVSNHLSWLDILVISTQWPVSFLSKSEVRAWPGIGAVATALGTLYIERGARNASGQANAVMAQRLSEGYRVIFFPEGTTSGGSELLPFRPRLYQAALDAGAPVQPLALCYLNRDGALSDAAPFVNNDPLLRHVIRLAGEPRTDCRINVCSAIDVEGRRRSELSALSRAAMANALGLQDAAGTGNGRASREARAEAPESATEAR
ncbi:lysophospholipid acyltransferase family protein [Aquisalimonas asiatica]|uniref:1-acyl-sn-glycerol-3-phosphate acyltransferase n=1 Tax=Aquisalimonas asiatica TaxID=406100 RepID=A0A1H8ST56_9GAMM|nr:lysophospholipid acyltransferase family protein [Aquisalimonas asiatica]SEO81676.1 1-acyl-sn-glycerol-3-phosphate acyltransferase [Aquisalimonas asiatica]